MTKSHKSAKTPNGGAFRDRKTLQKFENRVLGHMGVLFLNLGLPPNKTRQKIGYSAIFLNLDLLFSGTQRSDITSKILIVLKKINGGYIMMNLIPDKK